MFINQTYSFKLGIFTNVYTFEMEDFGLVIEKEKDVVCVYATSKTHSPIYCAIPVCHPAKLKGQKITINVKKTLVFVELGDCRIVIDYKNHKSANNCNLMVYGSDIWGNNVQSAWDDLFNKGF